MGKEVKKKEIKKKERLNEILLTRNN